MNPSGFRERIEQKIADLDLNVREVERLCGFKATHLSDIMSGRKKTLKEGPLATLAKVLHTDKVWLLHGVVSDSAASGKLASPLLRSTMNGVAEVGRLEDASILLIALNLQNGECSFFIDSVESELAQGFIIDPALAIQENEYARGFVARSFIRVSAKKLVRQSADVIYAIVDAKR